MGISMRTVLGVEQLEEYSSIFRGKRIGLITNFTGISADWSRDTAELFLKAGFRPVRIFTPEHGMFGAAAGEAVPDSCPPFHGIPVISLYGTRRRPSQEDLEGLDLLVYDIQDVGLRYYTYLYTMCYTLEAAAKCGIAYVILDRPNPLGGRIISGARIAPEHHSFVGDYELPLRYGLTIGEAACYFLKYARLEAEFTIIKMKNYTRDMLYPDTGLAWNQPSPALPSFESVLCYCGGCLFEALNISEGRGTTRPFQIYGAPFIDMDALYHDMKEALGDGGPVLFRRRAFVPESSKYKGEVCYGLEFEPLAPDLNFLPTALILMKAICTRYPDRVSLRAIPGAIGGHHLAVLSGNTWAEEFITGKMTMEEMREAWNGQLADYEEFMQELRIY